MYEGRVKRKGGRKFDLLLDFFLEMAYLLQWSLEIYAELERVPHIRAPVEVAHGFDSEDVVWVVHFRIIGHEKDSRQDVHLFHNHLQES